MNHLNHKFTDNGSQTMEEQLATYSTTRSCLALNNFKMDEWLHAVLILGNLPPAYKSIKTDFLDGLARPTTLKLEVMMACIIDKDACTQAESLLNTVGTNQKKAGSRSKPKGKKKEKKQPPGPCHHCGKEGHWQRDCRNKKKKPDQSGGGSSLNVVANKANTSADANEFLLCYAFSCKDWLMDSGATKHLTPYMSDFKSYTVYSELESKHVTLGDSKTSSTY